MPSLLLSAAVALLAPQSSPPPATTTDGPRPAPIASLDELPIEEAAPLRCGVAFAVVRRWQNGGDPRGGQYPDMATGGREFFIQVFAPLIDERQMTREELAELAFREADALEAADDGAVLEAMMPACLLMKEAAGF